MKVSIVTVVFNAEAYIADAIESVKNQSYENIEHIIIDGLSTDKTPEIIEHQKTANMVVVRESDDGIYDAMNKGISIATGDVIGILNADDWYEANAIQKVANLFARNRRLGLIYGAMRRIKADGTLKDLYGSKEKTLDSLSAPFNHPACFVKADIYGEIGMFDTDFSTAADYDWMLRLKNAEIPYCYHDDVFTNFRLVGVTGSSIGFPCKQIVSVLRKNGYSIIPIGNAVAYRYAMGIISTVAGMLPEAVHVRLKKSILPYAK